MEQVKSAYGDFGSALKKAEEIELTVTGRISGRKTSRPVWFVEERNKVYLLPISGSDSEWYKNVLKNPTVTLSANEVTYTTKVRPIEDSAKVVGEVIEKFRAKYGNTIRSWTLRSKRGLGGPSSGDRRRARGKRAPECSEENDDDRSTHERDQSGTPQGGRVRGVSENRLVVGALATMPDLRPRRLLRFLAQSPRAQTFSKHRPSDH
jgi:hypothetical protein